MPLQKYQIIEAYNKNGMEAVLALLANSADQSAILAQIGDGGLDGEGMVDGDDMSEAIVMHNGKKYNRVQIEGLGEETDYLMDEDTGNIYDLNFQLVTNMNDNLVIDDEEEEVA